MADGKCFNCGEPKKEGKIFCDDCEQQDRQKMFGKYGLRREVENFYDKI